MDKIILTTPLKNEDIDKLIIGQEVLINGKIYAARDSAHKKFIDLINKGEELPFDPKGQIIFYVGPSPAKPGQVIGAAGPTTSSRMDDYTPQMLQNGIKGMIGKGRRSLKVISAMKENKAVYFAAIGGAGALISKSILSSKVIAYPELGPEAVREMEVENFSVIVVNDVLGNDLYEQGVKQYSN